MTAAKPLDLLFLAVETPNRPVHMAGYELFSLPKDYEGDYIADLVASFRSGRVDPPFNHRVRWLEKGLARWEKVDPDLRYHVRHVAVPHPGHMDQLYELISFLNAPMLDRDRPLWECYVIEGVEDDRFAILLKVHHALMDGMGGMRVFENSLSTSARSREFKRAWAQPKQTRRKPRKPETKAAGGPKRFAQLIPGIQKTASSLLNTAKQLADFNPASLLMPFRASPSQLNIPLRSNARRFAACDLSLVEIKAVGKHCGGTVNDVVMTAIDIGLHRYLREGGHTDDRPLRVMMPVSLRQPGDADAGGNQVSVVLAELGAAGLQPEERLRSVMDSTRRIKKEAAKVPTAVLQMYTMLLAAGGVVNESIPGMDRVPTNNLLISNMPGPKRQMYLAGAPLIGFYGLPIVPPGCGLNVTFLSLGDKICLAIGANPDAVSDPFRLSTFIEDGFRSLHEAVLGRQAKRKTGSNRKRKSGKKPKK